MKDVNADWFLKILSESNAAKYHLITKMILKMQTTMKTKTKKIFWASILMRITNQPAVENSEQKPHTL